MDKDYYCVAPHLLLEDAFRTYIRFPWQQTGMTPETYLRDAVQLIVWHEYESEAGATHLFEALPRELGDTALATLKKLRSELRARHHERQYHQLLSLWSSFVVFQDRDDEFVPLARELASEGCILNVYLLTEVAVHDCPQGDELALAVFAAAAGAAQPGPDQDTLIAECRRVLGKDPPGIARARRRTPRRLGRRYALETHKANGALCAVWQAQDTRTGAPVAIKLPRPQLADSFALEANARLRHESDILGSLEHPAIVRRLTTAGRRAETPYLVMEYIDGESLDRFEQLPPIEAVTLLLPIIDALAFAHGQARPRRHRRKRNGARQRGPLALHARPWRRPCEMATRRRRRARPLRQAHRGLAHLAPP